MAVGAALYACSASSGKVVDASDSALDGPAGDCVIPGDFVDEDCREDAAEVLPDPCEGLGPECLPVVERGNIKVVYLHGTPYEMGFQHGTLLHEQLADGVLEIEQDLTLSTMMALALKSGLLELAEKLSLPEIKEECQGLVDAAGDVGWTMEHCMILNFGDAVAEFLQHGMPEGGDIQPACAEAIVSGAATADGATYQLRVLDWALIQFIVDNPVVFVRQPDGKIPHVFIGFPGNLSPYQGMNGEGLVSASNEVSPLNNGCHDSVGLSHVQLQARILAEAHDRAEAEAMVESANHMTLELFGVSDSTGGEIFEMAPGALAFRGQVDGVVYATNHFVAAETSGLDKDPPSKHSTLRYDRLSQLLDPGGEESLYGTLSPEVLVKVARDRIDPETGEESPADEFDNGKSLATNGALYAIVFDPAKLRFWVAAGALPVPSQTFVGFSLGELLGWPGYEGATPEDIQ